MKKGFPCTYQERFQILMSIMHRVFGMFGIVLKGYSPPALATILVAQSIQMKGH